MSGINSICSPVHAYSGLYCKDSNLNQRVLVLVPDITVPVNGDNLTLNQIKCYTCIYKKNKTPHKSLFIISYVVAAVTVD